MRKVPFPARCRTYNILEHVVAVVDFLGDVKLGDIVGRSMHSRSSF
jgi:hypothetical protein